MAISYLPDQAMFVSRLIAPGVPVGGESGTYNIFPRGEWLRPQGKKLANGEPAPLGGFKFTKDVYSVAEYGLAANFTQRDLNNAALGGISPTRLRNQKTSFVTFQAHLAMEIDMANMVRTAANWTETHAGVASAPTGTQFIQWDQATSTPIANIKAWKENMRISTGFEPNKVLMAQKVVNALAEHPDIIDRVKYSGSGANPGRVNLQTLAELFELDQIVVPKSVQNTAHEGQADAISDIWGKDVFLFYTPPTADMESPSALYRFNWVGDAWTDGTGPQPFGKGVNAEGLYINNYLTDRPAAEWVESRWYTVPKVTGPGLGILATAAVA